jgi:hypothetical protein
MNPEWVVAYLPETKGIPLSAEARQAFVDNGVGAATANMLQAPSLAELGITSPLLQARVLAALQSLRPLSQDHVASAPSVPPFDGGIFGLDQPLPAAIADPVHPGCRSGHVPDALFMETGIPTVEATPVFESSVATAVVVTEGDAKERGEGIHGSSSNSSAETSNCRIAWANLRQGIAAASEDTLLDALLPFSRRRTELAGREAKVAAFDLRPHHCFTVSHAFHFSFSCLFLVARAGLGIYSPGKITLQSPYNSGRTSGSSRPESLELQTSRWRFYFLLTWFIVHLLFF